MLVLHVSKLYPPFWGGVETVVYDVVHGLRNEDYKVDVLCVSEDRNTTIECEKGSTIFRCGSLMHLSSLYISLSFFYYWYKIRNSYDIIHVHFPNPLALIAIFLFRCSGKIVIHWHSDIVKQKILKIPFMPLQKWLLKRSNYVLATSPNYAESSKDLQRFKNKVRVVPIGIDPSSTSVDQNKLNHIKQRFKSKKIVFALGRHVYYKGFSYLIDAAKMLPDNYIVLIGGIGQLTNSLKQKVVDKGLTDKVYFVGKIPVNELGSYFKACDVFCLPSIERSEAYGVVQLEAMSFDKPVVSTSIPGSGVSWVNKDGVTGLICNPSDSVDLAEKIVNCEMIVRCGKIRQYFMENFTRDEMVGKIINIYEECI